MEDDEHVIDQLEELQPKRAGRPPNATRTIQRAFKLSLHPGEDDDLIDWFARIPAGLIAPSIMQALRQGIAVAPEPKDDATSALDALELLSDF